MQGAWLRSLVREIWGWLTVLAPEPSVLLAEGKQALAGQAPGAKDSACPGQQGKVETGGF